MKKKRGLEADLDPAGTRHTRPGEKAAERAVANSRAAPKRRGGRSTPTRPGSTAAERAVAATKRKRRGGA
jgi:hypothetical protein